MIRWILALATVVVALGQQTNAPSNMYCGGNQLVDMGVLRAEFVSGTVVDPSGAKMAGARVQLQEQGSEQISREIQADDKGRFHLPVLRPGVYWLGVSSAGLNLHFWKLRVVPGAREKRLRVGFTVGT